MKATVIIEVCDSEGNSLDYSMELVLSRVLGWVCVYNCYQVHLAYGERICCREEEIAKLRNALEEAAKSA